VLDDMAPEEYRRSLNLAHTMEAGIMELIFIMELCQAERI
jgi:hypothetical protein